MPATIDVARERHPQRKKLLLARALFYAPVGYALVAGLNQFRLVRATQVDPDVQSYLAIAQRFDVLSLPSGTREPVWPALLAIPVQVLGPHPWIARLLGVAGFVFMVLATQLLVTRRYGAGWAFVAALPLAASPWLIFQSARGLREETGAALIALFALGLISGPLTVRRTLVLSALAGVAGLLRWDTVIVTVPTLLLALLVTRSGVRQWIAATGVFAVIVSPLLLGNYLTTGDPFYHSNIHARFFRNLEFRDRPGFITSTQMAQNAYAGPPITWIGYLFGLHTPRQLANRVVSGFQDIPLKNASLLFFYPNTPSLDRFPTLRVLLNHQSIVAWGMAVLAVIGAVSLVRRSAWPLTLMLRLSIGVYSFISSLIDFRLAMNEIPMMIVADVEALVVLAPRMSSRIGNAIRNRLLQSG